jgi:hypothetical protein
MPSKSEAYEIDIALTDADDARSFKIDPTIENGDAVVYVDGISLGNMTNLPSAIAGTPIVPLSLTSDEMNGDTVSVLFHDQTSPAEWADFLLSLPTTDGERLNAIFSTVSSSPVTVGSPIVSETEIDLVRGDSYDGRIKNPKLIWIFSSSIDVVPNGVAKLTFRNKRSKTLLLQVIGLINTVDATTFVATFSLTSTQTSAFPIGREMVYDVEISEGLTVQTISIGEVYVKEDVTY